MQFIRGIRLEWPYNFQVKGIIMTAKLYRELQERLDKYSVGFPATTQNPAGMCNCCGDCCGVLKSLGEYPKPAEMVFSNHYVSIDQETCAGCEDCIDRCQMNALSMNDNEQAEVNLDRCIGCGLCGITCPTDSLQLVLKSEEKRRIPPVTSAEQMINMATKRGIQF